MISTELSSQVLGYKVESVTTVNSRDINQLLVLGEKTVEINVYELAHKCKEWALMHDFSIKSTYDFTHTCFASVYGLQRGSYFNAQADTEPEAIFLACQWILDNKGSK
jgi:hypothetical protein